MEKIYILGNGVMARAFGLGLKKSGFSVVIVGRDLANLGEFESLGFGVESYGQSYEIAGKNIILAFKPYALNSVAGILKGRASLAFSILAGTNLNLLKSAVSAENYAVALPNIAAVCGESITPFMSEKSSNLNSNLNSNLDSNLVEKILASVGKFEKFESESEFNAAAVIAGCGPAFLSLAASGLKKGGVRAGLKAGVAQKIVADLFASTAALLNSDSPESLIDQICSPKGTTIEGVFALEKNAVSSAFMEAVSKSVEKQTK